MPTEFPLLDMLDRYRMRSAYVMLMLFARSGTDFERLHGLLPIECRVLKKTLIGLKKERERLLKGRSISAQGNTSPSSDQLILREFDFARNVNQNLAAYYRDLLASHSLNIPLTSEQTASRDVFRVCFPSPYVHPWEKEWLRCTLGGLTVGVGINMVRSTRDASSCSEHKHLFHTQDFPTCSHQRVELALGVAGEDLNCERILDLLKLRKCDQVTPHRFGRRVLHYQFDLCGSDRSLMVHHASGGTRDEPFVLLEEDVFLALMTFLARQGIELNVKPIE